MITLERVETAKGRNQRDVFVVRRDGAPIGLISKFRDTRTEKCPWQAVKGVGFETTFLGSFYRKDGYKAAALAAVVDA
jgi:hypothetical protein